MIWTVKSICLTCGWPRWWMSNWLLIFPGHPVVAKRFSLARDHLKRRITSIWMSSHVEYRISTVNSLIKKEWINFLTWIILLYLCGLVFFLVGNCEQWAQGWDISRINTPSSMNTIHSLTWNELCPRWPSRCLPQPRLWWCWWGTSQPTWVVTGRSPVTEWPAGWPGHRSELSPSSLPPLTGEDRQVT